MMKIGIYRVTDRTSATPRTAVEILYKITVRFADDSAPVPWPFWIAPANPRPRADLDTEPLPIGAMGMAVLDGQHLYMFAHEHKADGCQ